ncbi:cold-shock protein [Actinomadura sp. WAC 06369]|uniref:cold-shock protein n=1 Tax=Actinomadura sp. WAC 06369 TaxID=2203193 RepID=UPI001F1C174B|nr:cold shock domain-containing protein [Actinomadura sp. WAC 06369]
MVRSGTIFSFDNVRGYGFIVPDGGGEDVFVHANDLLDDKSLFTPGTAVEFEVAQGERGPKAFAVRALDEPAAPERPPARRAAESFDDDVLCDVLSSRELGHEITDVLLAKVPELTGGQIVKIRESLLAVAQKHGWTED